MNTQAPESRKKTQLGYIPVLAGLIFWGLSCGCAYRLTNLHTASPNNIRTIHVEAIYDTGSEVVPHEQLWDELQRAIAANGQLHLAPAKSADATLRVQIMSTRMGKAGERRVSQPSRKTKEPNYFSGQTEPPAPGQLRNISVADDYYLKTNWQSAIRVELWDLNTRQLLLQREYPMTGEVLANRGDLPAQIHHLRHHESFNASFANSARNIAEKVVSDILVR